MCVCNTTHLGCGAVRGVVVAFLAFLVFLVQGGMGSTNVGLKVCIDFKVSVVTCIACEGVYVCCMCEN